LVLLVLALPWGCRRHSSGSSKPVTRATAPQEVPDEPLVTPYPHARWRLVTFEELNRTTLWVSHIVIRHARSNAGWFRKISWQPDPPAPERSELEALELANRVAKLAREKPDQFQALAREYSEDFVTRQRGGALGGVRATQLPREYLDALATLHPGQSSRVFQTPFGFHLVQLSEVPPNELLAGRRIAIGYEGTVDRRRDSVVHRNRDEAKALAEQVAREARLGKVPFAALVERYSDTADKIQGGDLGVRSRRDPEFFPEEVSRLEQLRVGEISEPVDSRFGFEILQRTAVDKRPRYAMSAIELKFDPEAPTSHEHSEAATLALANSIAAQIHDEPTRFEEFQRRYCCQTVRQWTEGRGQVGVAPFLAKLAVGEIARRPIVWDWFFLIPKRLDPNAVEPEPAPTFELPNPDAPDLAALVQFNSGPNIAMMARDLAKRSGHSLAWDSPQHELLDRILEQLATSLERDPKDEPDDRAKRINATVASLKENLGNDRFTEFGRFALACATDAMLK